MTGTAEVRGGTRREAVRLVDTGVCMAHRAASLESLDLGRASVRHSSSQDAERPVPETKWRSALCLAAVMTDG